MYNFVSFQNIILCNEGQATGLIKEKIHSAIAAVLPEVPLPKYIAEKGESYSFLIFNSIENSILFYQKCNGLLNMDKGPPVYMMYVKNGNKFHYPKCFSFVSKTYCMQSP